MAMETLEWTRFNSLDGSGRSEIMNSLAMAIETLEWTRFDIFGSCVCP